MIKQRRHFHSFNALRFVSFLLVFIHHIPINETSFLSYFTKTGGVGVSFFFSLSGFLITYILLAEKLEQNKISLKHFFIKRILKIWPLFYAMLLFAYLTPFFLDYANLPSSSDGYKPNWWYSVFFLENYQMLFTKDFPNVSPLRVMWSLCVEEHFYLIWGFILFLLPVKKLPKLILFCIFLAFFVRIIYFKYEILSIDIFSNIDYFAFGAIPAYLLATKNNILHLINNISLKTKYSIIPIILVCVIIFPLFNESILRFFTPTIYGFLFSTLILFTISSRNFIFINDKYVISKLGIYTYGLYLYHTIFINLFIQLFKNSAIEMKNVLIAISSLIVTIVISILSYHLFEKRFLNWKRYFNP